MRRAPTHARVPLLVGAACLFMGGCGLLGGRTREQKTLDALRSPGHATKRQVLLGLRGQVPPAVIGAVVRVLAADPDPAARAFAADALGRLARRGTVAQLRQSARQDSHELVRARSTRALVRILGPEAAEDLQFSIENDRDPAVRIEAIELAADALGVRQAARLIGEGLKDEAHTVKLAAYIALKDLTGQDVSPDDYESWCEYANGL